MPEVLDSTHAACLASAISGLAAFGLDDDKQMKENPFLSPSDTHLPLQASQGKKAWRATPLTLMGFCLGTTTFAAALLSMSNSGDATTASFHEDLSTTIRVLFLLNLSLCIGWLEQSTKCVAVGLAFGIGYWFLSASFSLLMCVLTPLVVALELLVLRHWSAAKASIDAGALSAVFLKAIVASTLLFVVFQGLFIVGALAHGFPLLSDDERQMLWRVGPLSFGSATAAFLPPMHRCMR